MYWVLATWERHSHDNWHKWDGRIYLSQVFVSEEFHLQFIQGPQCKPSRRRRPEHNRTKGRSKKIVNHSSETNGAPGFDQMASKPCDPCVVSGIR